MKNSLLLLSLAVPLGAQTRRAPAPSAPQASYSGTASPKLSASLEAKGVTVVTPGAPVSFNGPAPAPVSSALREAGVVRAGPAAPPTATFSGPAPAPLRETLAREGVSVAGEKGPPPAAAPAARSRAAFWEAFDRLHDAPPAQRAAALDALFDAARAARPQVELAAGRKLEELEAAERARKARPVSFIRRGEPRDAFPLILEPRVAIVVRRGLVPSPSDVRIHGRELSEGLRDILRDPAGRLRSLWGHWRARLFGGEPPRRLVVGEGRLPLLQRRSDVTMDLREPGAHVRGDVRKPPFADASFSEVYWERLPYTVFTGDNAGAIAQAHRVLRPGGRLVFLTGSAAPWRELVRELHAAGFVKVFARRDGSVVAEKARAPRP